MSIYLQHPDKCGFLISTLVLGGEKKLMLMGWNHGLVKGSGRIPTGFAMARISQQKGLGIQKLSLPPQTAWMLNQEPTESPLSCCLPTVLPQKRLFRSRDCPGPGPGAARPSAELQGRADTHGLTVHTHAPCLAGPLRGPTCKITSSCAGHFGTYC